MSFERIFTPVLKQFSLKAFAYPEGAANPELAKLMWLVRLRWLAIASFFALTLPAWFFQYLDRQTMPIYIGLLGLLFLVNFLTQIEWADKRKFISPVFVSLQLTVDLLALSGLLYLVGGFQNPFFVLFLLHAALGGILIPGRFAWQYLVLIHTLVGFLQFEHFMKIHEVDSREFFALACAFHMALFVFWLVMRYLGEYLEKQSEVQTRSRVLLERQDRLRAVGALTAGFSHEFASPLNAAKLRLSRLEREPLSLSQREELARAVEAVGACEAIVQQINSSQMDARDFHKKTVRLEELVRDIVESWKGDHAEVETVLILKDVGQQDIAPLNFAQVLLNLLDNAYEAGGDTSQIHIQLSEGPGTIVLRVSDQGEGFTDLVKEKLGEPFNTTKEHGTGLGLYVSQLFVESMGGRLQLTNNFPKGATVTLEWPSGGERV